MSQVNEKNGKSTVESPIKQRTPLQLRCQKNIGVYFAQSKRTIDSSTTALDSSESDEDYSDDIQITNSDSVKKRKARNHDPLTKKLTKIRKTFDGNVSFANEEDENSLKNEAKEVLSPEKGSPKKILQTSLSSNIELTIKHKDLLISDDKENVVDTQDTLDGLDDLFEEEWTYEKDSKDETENLDNFFEDNWTYENESKVDFSTPTRCIILDIIWEKSGMTLTVKDHSIDVTTTVKCFGIWRYTKIEPGEPIIIKAKQDATNEKHWIVDNNYGWIINQPDTLVSGTSVVGALFCNRRSSFMEKFRQIESLPYNETGNTYMLTGSLTHELFQKVFEKNITDIKAISAVLDETLKSKHAIEMMYSAGVSSSDCKHLMRPSVAQIYNFIQRYIKGVQPEVSDQNYNGKIVKICDIEENVWLPSLGLKGKIDLTVEVSDSPKNNLFSSNKRVLPLELKTGRSSFSSEHQGQLILYTMMMDMTDRKVNSGLLLYLRENIMREIIGSNNAQRDLITLRNTVAYYMTRQPTVMKENNQEIILPMEFPKPISHPACAKCPYNVLCSTYLTEEDKNEMSDSHPLKNLSETCTSHLSPEHIEYVKRWVSLLQLEENTDNQDAISWKDVWTIKPSKREKKGSCISNLRLINVHEVSGRFLHEFQKSEENEKLEIKANDFSEQEYVIISTKKRVNICSGYIQNISTKIVSVHCEKDITKVYKDAIFHIDKSSSISLLTHNMSQLGGLLDDHEICSRLRKIVIERQPATFKTDLPISVMEVGKEIFEKLNENQKQAILKTLSADDFVLIKGFPGTGKTQTLVAMIELLVKLDKSVLVTAHTNTAIDNILLKLVDRKIDFLRFGSHAKTHPGVRHKLDDFVTAECDSPESLHTVYCSKKVVGVTCYGSIHPHLSRRKFDICIVDESTQVLQPTILRPLYCASKFVLVGDPEQLPPIARNNTARKLGMNESLFSRLDSEHNSVALTVQYRMNKCIMDIANKLTYHDQLQIDNEEISNATLPVTNIADFESCEKWIRKALSLRLKNSAVMLNTSATHHLAIRPDFANAKGSCNFWEAGIIMRLIQVLKNVKMDIFPVWIVHFKLGIDSQTVGVIAPYRAQVNLLRSKISADIEVNTVDQYQGRDKSVIIYSCSKSISTDQTIPEFDILEDHQRLTVAVTRAKHKLIIIGDLNTLNRFTPFQKLITALGQERIYDLKEDKDDFCFDDLMQLLL